MAVSQLLSHTFIRPPTTASVLGNIVENGSLFMRRSDATGEYLATHNVTYVCGDELPPVGLLGIESEAFNRTESS